MAGCKGPLRTGPGQAIGTTRPNLIAARPKRSPLSKAEAYQRHPNALLSQRLSSERLALKFQGAREQRVHSPPVVSLGIVALGRSREVRVQRAVDGVRYP